MGNWQAVVFLLASGQGILLSLALLTRRKQQFSAGFFLGLMLLTISLELLNAWGMQVKYHSSSTAFPFWLLQSYLLLPISLYFFVQLTTNPAFQMHKKHWLFFIPAGAEILVEAAFKVNRMLTGSKFKAIDSTAWFLFADVLPIFGMVAVLYIFGKQLLVLSRQIKEFLPTAPRTYFLKLYSFFGFLITFTGLWIAGVLFNLPIFKIVEAIITVFLFALGYIGYFKPAFFEVPALVKAKFTEPTTTFPNYHDQQELERLQEIFERKALHTQPKLALEDVAAELKLPARYVSYLINTYHHTNFHYFVNSFRVQEVIRKMNDPREQHKTLLALALESGFNSKSTFNEVFKNHTGQSPSKYLQPVK